MSREMANNHASEARINLLNKVAQEAFDQEFGMHAPFPDSNQIPSLSDTVLTSCIKAPKEHVKQALELTEQMMFTADYFPVSNPRKFHTEISRTIIKHIPLLDRYFTHRDTKEYVTNICRHSYRFGETGTHIDSLVEKYFPFVVREFFTGNNGYGELLSQYLRQDSDRIYEILETDRRQSYEPGTWKPDVSILRGHVDARSGEKITLEMMKHTLYRYNLYSELYYRWANYEDLRDVDANIETIISLMEDTPDVTHWIYENRGIELLGRYEDDILTLLYELRSYKAHDCTIVYASSKRDTHVIGDSARYTINSLHRQTNRFKNQGWSIKLELIEFDDPATLSATIRSLADECKQMIVVYDDHGDRLHFSTSSQFPVQKDRAHILNPYYEISQKPDLLCVMNSCSTGKRGGIAQALSKTGVVVLAPEEDCLLLDLLLHVTDQGFVAIPNYSHAPIPGSAVRAVHYENGKEQRRAYAIDFPATGIIYMQTIE